MDSRFAGIYQKLERADENIINLQSEISRFFESCEYPVIPKLNDKRHLEAVQYHRELTIPIRFSVLAGESIHQLRSCLDHIVWQLSIDSYRISKHGKFIEFPVLEARPPKENRPSQFVRKVKGITSLRALKLIVGLQPYRSADPKSNLIWIIHDMDRIDKHRDLIIIRGRGNATVPLNRPDLAIAFARYVSGTSGPMPPALKREFDDNCEITPEIAFNEVGGRVSQSVVPLLAQLSNYTRNVVGMFESA